MSKQVNLYAYTIENEDVSPTNGFTEKTHIPSDSMFEISLAEFERLFQEGMITKTGELTEDEYQLVLNGIRQSKRMAKATKIRILGECI